MRSDDPIADILRLTGARPAAPPEIAHRVRAAAREAWRAEVDRRRRRWRFSMTWGLSTAGVAAVALAVWLASHRGHPAPDAAGVIEAASGEPGAPGTSISVGTEVSTGEGRIALRLATGHAVRLDRGSAVVLDAGRLTLRRGALYVDSSPAGATSAAPIEIATPLATLRELGTRYEVRLDAGSMSVRVRDGAVRIAGDRRNATVSAGREARIVAGGALEERYLAPYDAAWAWTATIAPAMAIEGRTASEFLAWAARERGLDLKYGDVATERAAAAAILKGSIDGLSVDDALATVLPTCRLTHRIDGGILVVATAAAP